VTLNIPAKVKNYTIGFARRVAHPPSRHLHIQSGRLGWTEEGDKVNPRVVETCSKDVAVSNLGKATNFNFAEENREK